MTQKTVFDPEFCGYGRVIHGYDMTEMIRAMEKLPIPLDVVYEPSVKELEELSAARELEEGLYGQMPVQIGYCNGHNRKLNALEYHRDSEINLAATDLILLLGRQQDMDEDYTYDTSLVEAFLVPKGTLIEIYATTLHYAPCQTGGEGFRCMVLLPKGTNEPLTKRPEIRWGEDKLLFARNKWLIGHREGGLPSEAWIGLSGENISV